MKFVDIALSLNRTLQVPLLVVIESILRNTQLKRDLRHTPIGSAAVLSPIRFNLLVPLGDKPFFKEKIQAAFAHEYGPDEVVFRIKEFTPPDFLKQYLDNKFQEKSLHRRQSRYMQYARFFLKVCFADISRVIYLDGDTLVLGDIRELFAQGDTLNSACYLAAVPQLFPAVFYFSNPFKMWSELRQFKNTFNSGVLLTDLSYWNQQTYRSLEHYLALDAGHRYRLYHLGDETVFNLMFKRTYRPLSSVWNTCGYGQIHLVSRLLTLRRRVEEIQIIHWSGGHHKPWQSDKVIYSALWRSYLPSASKAAISRPQTKVTLQSGRPISIIDRV